MKKLIALILAVAFLLSILVACGGEQADDKDKATDKDKKEKEKEKEKEKKPAAEEETEEGGETEGQ